MQEIIDLGINEGYFEYNAALKKVYPIWEHIDSEDFIETFNRKESEYDELLKSFDKHLQDKYNIHYAKEVLSNHVQSFIQRYGLVSKANRQVLYDVKSDYYFAEYLLDCFEKDDQVVLNYVDNYITACAFAETLTFRVPTNEYGNCHARVFLDTGFIFALLGIESKDRSNSFKQLLDDIKNIFITTNRSLARVGKLLIDESLPKAGTVVPISLTDLDWGTLVWTNSPTRVSEFNRSSIISAAYAAFQPSEKILRKLNTTLEKNMVEKTLTPEMCYFLKTDTIALRLLSKKTQNDENLYSDYTPFEII